MKMEICNDIDLKKETNMYIIGLCKPCVCV